MHDFLEISTGKDEVVEYADWAEICTIFKDDANVSEEDLAREIQRSGARNEVRAREFASAAFQELADRSQSIHVDSIYPFDVDGDLLTLERKPHAQSTEGLIYLFLLAITRASMSAADRTVASVDPTAVFERLCGDVLREFWGGSDDTTAIYRIGTAKSGKGKRHFPSDIDALCLAMGEGQGWKNGATSPGAGDGGVDIAVWRRFIDGRPGGLVGFAQCKTGRHWREHLGKNSPRSFCTKYMRRALLLDPLKIYMVPGRINENRWNDDSSEVGGLLFDRCRIASFGGNVQKDILSDCWKWYSNAIQVQKMAARPTMKKRTSKAK